MQSGVSKILSEQLLSAPLFSFVKVKGNFKKRDVVDTEDRCIEIQTDGVYQLHSRAGPCSGIICIPCF